MVRRANFQTKINMQPEDLELLQDPEVKALAEGDNPNIDLPIERVFAFDRIKRPIGLWTVVFFSVWTPFGLVLLVLRLGLLFTFLGLFWLIGGFPSLRLLNKQAPFLFINIIAPICGIVVQARGLEYKNAAHVDKCIFVANHISNFDPIWFNNVFGDFTLLCAGDYDYFWEAMKRIGLLNTDDRHGKGCIYTNYFGSKAGREEVRISIEEDMARSDGRPFLIYPEGCVTTGVSAVMQYQKFVFSLDKVIVPTCLSVYNPWPYEHYTLTSGAVQHLCWYLFSPFIIFKQALLPPQKIRKDEKPTEFALRVQCMTAAHLGLGVIKMNWKQKDRLSQALGFMDYNENYWSRRESMDNFREALYQRKVVLRDGEAFSTGERSGDKGSDGRSFSGSEVDVEGAFERQAKTAKTSSKKVVPLNLAVKDKNRSQSKLIAQGTVLAKEYAARHHQEREPEMKIFDEAMKKAGAQKKKKGERSYREKMVDKDINEEMVIKTNMVRRLSTMPDVKPHSEEVHALGAQVKEKRRLSSLAATQEQLQSLALANGEGLSEEAMKAIKDAADIAAEQQEHEIIKQQLKAQKEKEKEEKEKQERAEKEKKDKETTAIDMAERGEA